MRLRQLSSLVALLALAAGGCRKKPVETAQPVALLHEAAHAHDPGLCRKMIAEGADVNAADNDGDTPLHNAARKGHGDMIELLIACGADVWTRDKRGNTPLDEAVQRENAELVHLLRQHAARE